jgi:hypothetical protein
MKFLLQFISFFKRANADNHPVLARNFYIISAFSILLLVFISPAYGQQKTVAAGLEGISDAKKLSEDAEYWIDTIDAVSQRVQQSKLYKTVIDGEAATFPMAILGKGDDTKYALIINKVNLDPVVGLTAQIFMKIPYKNDSSLYFLADKVPLSKRGKLTGDFKLLLLRTVSMKVGDGYNIKINGIGTGGKGYDSTYVTFNCKGFKDVTINGSVDFNPKTVAEHTENGPGKPLSLKFYITADRLTNLLLKFRNIPAIQFKSLPGFKCTVPEITLDKSEIKNAPEFKLPTWYVDSIAKKNPGFNASTLGQANWEGVYIPEINIELPKSFSEGTNGKPGTIISKDLIVDQQGITFYIAADNGLVNGHIKGFNYSVDTVRVKLIASTLTYGKLAGKMNFPICKENSTVAYGLTVSKGMKDDDLDYKGYGDLKTKLNVQAFGLAQIHLTGCRIDFKYTNKQFFPEVDLDGSITMSPSKKDETKPTTAGNMMLAFNRFQILSGAPYIDIGANGFFRLKGGSDSSNMGKLPITIDTVRLVKSPGGERVGLGMALIVHLQKSNGNSSESGNGFNGKVDFTIWAKRNPTAKKWGYDDFDLNEITLNVKNGSFNLDGSLKLFNGDKIYGKGFCGYLNVELIDKIKVKAAAIFGKKTTDTATTDYKVFKAYEDGGTPDFDVAVEKDTRSIGATIYRYWCVDAMVSFSPGLPIFSGIELNSFTGGLYYNMKMLKPGQATGSNIDCKTASGRVFVPNDSLFGVLAGVGIQSMGGGNAFNGEINFGIEFNKTLGGISKIATWGGVGFLTMNFQAKGLEKVADKMSGTPINAKTKDENKDKEPSDPDIESSVKATWYVEYDFPAKTLVGDFNIYIKMGEIVQGKDNGKAGRISIYSSPSNWYVYVGRPVEEDMIGVKVLNLAEIGGYMCLGSELPNPAIAPMPPEIKDRKEIDYSLLSLGGGLSFGARLTIEGHPGINLGFCDAGIEMHFVVKSGFDILLSKTSQPIYCAGHEERGFKNWYATGQAYLYGEANLRAKYKCLGGGDIDLLSMYLSAYVFVQLPKPTYMTGNLKAGFKFMGEWYDKEFSFNKGDQCNPENELSKDVNFIEAISPVNDQKEVSIGEKIHVYFSHAVNTFNYSLEGSGGKNTFRAFLDEKNVSVIAGTQKIECFYELEPGNKHLVLTPKKVFPGSSEITVTVKIETQLLKDSWIGTDKSEIKTVKFTTVKDPGYISLPDVYYAYPLPDMENFYKNESSKGYIRLSVLPGNAVKLAPDYEFAVSIILGAEEVDRVRNVKYNGVYGENNFEFELPTFRMEPGRSYTLRLLKSVKQTNVSQDKTKEGNIVSGVVNSGRKDTTILEYKFKTSTYNSFKEKMAVFSTTYTEVFSGIMGAGISAGQKSNEGLSDYELNGFITNGIRRSDALVQFAGMSYDNKSQDDLNTMIKTIGAVDLKKGVKGNYTVVSDLVSELNTLLSDVNMKCLLSGGCSAGQMKTVRIPKGKVVLEIGYFLPGKNEPTSKFNLVVDLDKDLVIPQ